MFQQIVVYSVISLLLFLMLVILILMVYFAIGPRRAPRYAEVKTGRDSVHYEVNGILTPIKPEPRSFTQKLAELDGLRGGWSDSGRGADG